MGREVDHAVSCQFAACVEPPYLTFRRLVPETNVPPGIRFQVLGHSTQLVSRLWQGHLALDVRQVRQASPHLDLRHTRTRARAHHLA
jgi:hypothetical protein